jgi:hypothetical protein
MTVSISHRQPSKTWRWVALCLPGNRLSKAEGVQRIGCLAVGGQAVQKKDLDTTQNTFHENFHRIVPGTKASVRNSQLFPRSKKRNLVWDQQILPNSKPATINAR